MRQQTARINVTLPKELIESVNQIAGPRSRSRLIAESLREHIRQMKKVEKDSKVKADQIRTLDKSRVVKRIGSLDKKDLDAIDKAMKIHLALS